MLFHRSLNLFGKFMHLCAQASLQNGVARSLSIYTSTRIENVELCAERSIQRKVKSGQKQIFSVKCADFLSTFKVSPLLFAPSLYRDADICTGSHDRNEKMQCGFVC